MARILIGTVPIGGHVAPMAALARGLVDAGHEVVWYSGAKYRSTVELTGARFVGRAEAVDFDDSRFEHIPDRAKFTGIDQLKFDLKHLFIDDVPGQVADLRAIAAKVDPDLLLADPGLIGGLLFHELEGLPLAVLGVLPMTIGSVDTAPYGLGLAPNASAVGRLRNRALRWS
ncbi:MAG: glycosyltransferase, partial [Polyangiaceae bacterium]|nr:glycosyltransferase [Polyangiaceae bacterium]